MNHCKIVEDLMPLYLDELVSPETAEYVSGHLTECAGCRTLYEQLKTPPPAEEPPDYEKPLKISILKIALQSIAYSVAALLFFGYLAWEVGLFAERKVVEAPDGISKFEVLYKKDAGFFANSGAYIRTPDGRGRQYTGREDFVDCHVWWAPNSEYYFLWVEFTDRDLTSYWGNDGPETYEYDYDDEGNVTGWRRGYDDRFYPKDETFFETMTAMLRQRPELGQSWETIEYGFGQWREDSLAFSLTFETDGGQTGTVWFSIESNGILCVT